jgi:hypothetical protein
LKTPTNEEEHKKAQQEESEAQAEKNLAVRERAKAKKAFEKMISSHCRRADPFPALETIERIQKTVEDYKNLVGCLDLIWSAVCGMDLGLLLTVATLVFFKRAIAEVKRRWLELGLSTLQPKWHLTFDGHLLHCVDVCGGLADKSDEAIKKGHQE